MNLHSQTNTIPSAAASTWDLRPRLDRLEQHFNEPDYGSRADEQSIGTQEAQRILGKGAQILKPIGQGATCSVFLVITALNMFRAYKVARISRRRQFEAVQKAIGLIWETTEGARHLLHAMVDYCPDPEFYFVASPLLDPADGGTFNPNTYRPKTLFSWLSSRQRCNGALGKNDAIELIDFLIAALDGLNFFHRNGLVYNDVHPGNVGSFRNRPVWIDYSAITFLGDECHEGAPWYAAPEGREATPAHDYYSLVKILIEGLAALHPAIIQPIAISEICQQNFKGLFGEVISHIARKGLAIDPAQRYQSASELMRDLQHAKQLLAQDVD